MIRPMRRRTRGNEPEDLVRLLVTVNRLRRRYDKGHSRLRGVIAEFLDSIALFLARRNTTAFRIVMRDGSLTHDRAPLTPDDEYVEELARLLTQLDCGGVALRADLTHASMNALLDWMAGTRSRPAPGTCPGIEFVGASAVDRAAGVNAPFGLTELDRAFQIAAASRFALEQIFNELRDGHPLDAAQVHELVQWIMGSLDSEGRRVTAAVFLAPPAATPSGHATHVFLLSIALLHAYARDRKELEGFCTAALLHDVGMARLPSPDRGGDDGDAERHPRIGGDILLDNPAIPALAIEVAFTHHLTDPVSDDGAGDAADRGDPQSSPVADAVHIADRIARLTGRGKGRERASFPAVLSALMEEPAMHSKRDVIQAYLADFTPTPPGTLIRVRSGAIGVVLDVHPDLPDRPRIALVQDGTGRDLDRPTVIDLLEDNSDELSIAEALPRPAHPLRTER